MAKRSKRARTPIVMQMEMVECGAACLGIVLEYFGRWIPLEELRETCHVSRDGCNAADIRQAAEHYGLKATGWRKEVDQLANMTMPLILFWSFNHFIVLEGVRGERFLINDPAFGRRAVKKEEFGKLYTGVALEMTPMPDFQRSGKRPGVMKLLWPWLRDFVNPLTYAAACGLLLALPGLASPLLLAGFVDYVLQGNETSLGGLFFGAMVAVAVLLYLLTWMQQRCLRRLSWNMSVVKADQFVARLLRLPIGFFSRRQPGDLVARLQSIDNTAESTTRQLVVLSIELVMTLLFLALMIAMDVWLALAVTALALLCMVLMQIVSRFRVDSNRIWRKELGMLCGVEMSCVGRIDTAHVKAQEDDCLALMSGHQAREVAARQKFLALGQLTSALPGLFQFLGGALVLGLGGWRVMTGDLSIGLLMGFFIVTENFLRPVGRFLEFADNLRVLEADALRVQDILSSKPDITQTTANGNGASGGLATLGGRLRANGRVRFDNVTFGYRHDAPLVQGFDLTLEPGQRAAIVGPSGSGKSTLAGLLAGLHHQSSGEIFLDGHRLVDVPPDVLTRSIAFVDQRIQLFEGTIRDNLTMWDPTVPEEDLVAAAKDAAIHDEIIVRGMGYDTLVAEGGSNFSAGQRQRLEIARALVNNPSVLVLDEATASLDPVVELRVDDALRRRGCTCLIVAHRLSTIRDADLIIVLEGGKELQRGTHEELLLDQEGLYAQLLGEVA